METKVATPDQFMRRGRIGPTLLAKYILVHKVNFTLDECTFDARQNPDPKIGFAEVALQLPGRLPWVVTVGKLREYLKEPDGLTRDESAYFVSLNIGWLI